MSNLSSAILRFLIAILLFSASTFSRCNLCSAAGFSESSSGVPEGRGSLPSPNCTRKFWMTASRSCRAERISFAGEMSVLVHGCDLTEALALITLPLLFLRRGALLHSDTSMLAICGEEEDVEVWKRNSINIKMRSKGEVDLFKSIFIYGHSFSHLGHGYEHKRCTARDKKFSSHAAAAGESTISTFGCPNESLGHLSRAIVKGLSLSLNLNRFTFCGSFQSNLLVTIQPGHSHVVPRLIK